MKFAKWAMFALVLLAVAAYYGAMYLYGLTRAGGYMNMMSCPTLNAGIYRDQLVGALGKPVSWRIINETYMNYTFDTPPITAENISALIDEETGIVTALHCPAEP